ncbi:DUF3885 domain-containing protein [Lysinibacillus sp. BW-2-10]|uniref:DUF3885 domain-containing protein n=1 Tax=Lysinibacillus sp. BW-2-10 TaxID=2590030 RepID=UPI00117CCBF6|nr:DUF3885 domain-containing protein [Lysinibacillus sp. BW-2-10]TSI05979.1 DUF3885 domain-containing protein [Lysinibacillus sp. BW-2-10]
MEYLTNLLNQKHNWIRFELGVMPEKKEEYLTENYFQPLLNRAKQIVNSLFQQEDQVVLIICTYQNALPNINRFLINPKDIYRLKYEEIDCEDGKEFYWSVSGNKASFRLPTLLRAIANADFSVKPKIEGQVYLINTTTSILFHMYDDRGCDVYSVNQDVLRPIYHQFRRWILDYDRLPIDRAFKEGLFQVTETVQEKLCRINKNRELVRAMEVNLRIDNTMTIVHSLTIPYEKGKSCLQEIEQTGFQIIYERAQNTLKIWASKIEALALIDYQTELIALYAKKYEGIYEGWVATKVHRS